MKNYIVILLLFFTASLSSEEKECTCGSVQEGLVDYSVVVEDERTTCCTGAPHPEAGAWLTTFVYSDSGVWEVDRVVRLSSSEAQNRCCISV